MLLQFFVAGTPIAQPRPRIGKRGGAYYPGHVVKWRNTIFGEAVTAKKLLGRDITVAEYTGEIGVLLAFQGAKGNSDVDNLAKLVLDALQGILYHDDRQVSVLNVRKELGIPAGVLIKVEYNG